MEEIRKKPYEYICNWAENQLIHVGKQTFELLALLPCSLIIPDIPFGNKDVRSQINVMVIASPSGGKSSLSDMFKKISMNPITFRRITSAELISQIIQEPLYFTIINEDFTQIAEDYDVIKAIEGIIGDERRISDKTSRRNADIETRGVALLCGTPSDLTRYVSNLEGGMFFRLVPMMISHTAEQHSKIGEIINSKIGDDEYTQASNKIEEKVIKYYEELRSIQAGKHATIKPILKYYIPENIKKQAYDYWNRVTKNLVMEMEFNWFRELHEIYRFMIAHAFLNIYNRKITPVSIDAPENKKIEGNILHITEEDYSIGLKLLKQNIRFKYCLIRATQINRQIGSAELLRIALESSTLPSEAKEILKNISPYSAILGFDKSFN